MTQEFNSDEFLDAVQNEAVETKFTPVPVGEYEASIKPGSVKLEPVQFRDGGNGRRFTCQWVIADAAVIASTGMQEPTVRQQFLLDLVEGTDSKRPMAAGKNKNIRLGKIVEAGGLPNPGYSFRQFDGLRAKVRVDHRPDKDDAEIVYAEVKAVTKL